MAEYEEENEGATLWEYLQDVSLLSDTDKVDGEETGVSLMTVHSAKGTEYDLVFVTGLEQGLFPSLRAMDEGELEEERRLCYVGTARARKNCFCRGAGNTAAIIRAAFGVYRRNGRRTADGTIDPVRPARRTRAGAKICTPRDL